MALKFSLVCDTLAYVGWNALANPREVFTAAKEAGYDGVDLPGDLSRVNVREIKGLLDSLGLAVPAIQGAWAAFHAGENRDLCGADKAARQAGIRYAKLGIDMAAEFGARYFSVCAPQPPIFEIPFPKLPVRVLWQNLLESVREILRHAGERGVTVVFEPLNRYESYPGIMSSVFDAIRLIDEIGDPNLGIQPDIYHMHVAETSIVDALRAAGSRTKHVHVNETNRYQLGAGSADYRAILRALRDAGFDGYLSFYMPITTQGIFRLGKGYGSVGDEHWADEPVGTRPDLKPYLEWPVQYLTEIDRLLDQQDAIYRRA